MNRDLRSRTIPPIGILLALFGLFLWVAPSFDARDAKFEQLTAGSFEHAQSPVQESVVISFESERPFEEAALETKQRPLFLEARRPWTMIEEPLLEETVLVEPEKSENSVPLALKAPPQPPRVRFLGLITVGVRTLALVELSDVGMETWVTLGSEVEGWTVAEMRESELLFRSDDQEFLVKLER